MEVCVINMYIMMAISVMMVCTSTLLVLIVWPRTWDCALKMVPMGISARMVAILVVSLMVKILVDGPEHTQDAMAGRMVTPSTPETRNRTERNCWNCGEHNHIAKNCRHGQRISCYKCSGLGHKEKYCQATY
jgi:hypothetical protein